MSVLLEQSSDYGALILSAQAPAVSCLWAVRLPWAHSKPRLSAVCGPSGCHGHTPSPGCQLSVGCQAAMGTLQAPVVSCLWAVRLPWAHSKPRLSAVCGLSGCHGHTPSLAFQQNPSSLGKGVVNQRLELVSGASWQPRGTAVSRQSTRPYL